MIVKKSDARVVTGPEGFERIFFAGGGKLMSTQVNMKKGVVGPNHSHPHEQVNYILSGSLEVTIAGEKTVITAGDSYYVEPNIEHGAVALLDTVMFETFTPIREDLLQQVKS